MLEFDAKLEGIPRVSARIAVGCDEHLTAVHEALQEAFGWDDDHLYSFWLDGRYWGDRDTEYTRPDAASVFGDPVQTADVPLADLRLQVDRRLAYVFDFGDEWRVTLALKAITPSDAGPCPRVIKRTGQAPPQYAHDAD